MTPLGHQMILASAGSGKTYALTHRYVRLLALGAPPERIVALTFTRKAAGEFFDEILKKLATAARQPAEAAKLIEELGLADDPHVAGRPPTARFLELLRQVVDTMPRLSLGTLDGFYARIVRSFPLELGLAGDFQVMEEAAAARERQRVLRRMFAVSGAPDGAQQEFIEAFKRATFGVEEKRLGQVLDDLLNDYAEHYLEAPEADRWGDPRAIWPDGSAWLEARTPPAEAAAAWRTALAGEPLNDKQRARLDALVAALAEWNPGAPLPAALEYILKNAFEAGPALEEITLERKKVALPPAARTALRELVAAVAGGELARRLERTRGIFAVLQGYERTYHETVRRAGRLTFADVLRLLLPAAGAPTLSGGAAAARAEEARLTIDWRLDAQFDHWLLDEFQDTSYAQWSVLRNLIDEVVQDPERRRSFFYVGDVKQAIFGWRGGDPRLFREISDYYNGIAEGAIGEASLDVSWRSGAPIVAMVNRTFGDAAALRTLLPAPAAGRWTAEWREHATARPKLGGYAELRHAADKDGRFAETLRLLQEIEPQRRGLTVAVLVRSNDLGAELADFLREGRIAAVAESDLHVALDNPLTGALLALLRAAAYPGDTLAQEHVRMTPLAALLAAEKIEGPDALTRRVLTELHADGFATTIERWLRRLGPAIAGDAFSLERGRLLVAAAAEFDESGSRDVAEFLAFAERFTVRDVDTAGVVRVMTVHKSKGLGFDLTILPDLEGQSLDTPRDGLAVKKDDERAVQWVFDPPNRLFAEADPVLAEYVAGARADAAYENLCLLYVAMTRAKRAMYVITQPPGAKSTSRNFARLLQTTLGETWADGDPQWYEQIEPSTADEAGAALPEAAVPSGVALPPRPPRLLARRPSAMHAEQVPAAASFVLETSAGAQFGTDVHAMLAEVECAEAAAEEGRVERWAGSGAPAEAVREAAACLREPALAEVWRRRAEAEVWRERAFEVVLDGVWVTGVCDRVVIERAAGGRASRAEIFDFKTDRVATEADVAVAVERHQAQLNVYRRVVAMLTGLPVEAVACRLVFTRLRRLADVPRE